MEMTWDEIMWQKAESRGESRGENRGLAEGKRQAIADLCELLHIEMTAERRTQLLMLGLEDLDRLRRDLKQQRAWPK